MVRAHSLFTLTVLAMLSTAMRLPAATIMPTQYDMLNGQKAAFNYFDEKYSGSGNKTENLALLTGGLGDLTDGVVPTQSWNVTPAPYVGWLTINPTIRFHFDGPTNFAQAIFYFDDSQGDGGVRAPRSITLTDGTNTKTVPIADSPARGRFFVAVNDLGLTGSWIDATITKDDGQWMMMSEVTFDGAVVPEPTTSVMGALLAAVATTFQARRRRAPAT